MVNHARAVTTKITDWLPGSVARTLVEAPAVEIEELYLQTFNGLREAIPVATFKSFNFAKLPARFARGFVSVASSKPLLEVLDVPVGTEFRTTDGRVYLSTELVTFLQGETSITVPVQAETAGSAYNVSPGSITDCLLFDDTFTISNSAIDNGADAETTAEQEARFAEYVAALSKGTIAALLYGAKQADVRDGAGNITEYVTRGGYIETPGFVRMYIYSSSGLPSATLIANAQKLMDGYVDPDTGDIIPGYRCGGIRTDILSMVERLVPLTAQVEMLNGQILTPSVIQNMTNVYATTLANTNAGSVLYLGSLETDLLSVTGVKRVVLGLDSNIVCNPFEVLKPGNVDITEISTL